MLTTKNICVSRYWSRSKFTMQTKCDTLVNMSEAFNNVIAHARTKPIITMLEEIRLYIMKRWSKNRSKVKKYEGEIYPKIRTRLVGIKSITFLYGL